MRTGPAVAAPGECRDPVEVFSLCRIASIRAPLPGAFFFHPWQPQTREVSRNPVHQATGAWWHACTVAFMLSKTRNAPESDAQTGPLKQLTRSRNIEGAAW